jgi:hypothetical protein
MLAVSDTVRDRFFPRELVAEGVRVPADAEIRTHYLAKPAVGAVLGPGHDGLSVVAPIEDVLGAYRDADTAGLAPPLVEAQVVAVGVYYLLADLVGYDNRPFGFLFQLRHNYITALFAAVKITSTGRGPVRKPDIYPRNPASRRLYISC